MAKSQTKSVFSLCQDWLPVLLTGLLWAGTCMAQAGGRGVNLTGPNSLAEVTDSNTGLVEARGADTAPGVPGIPEPQDQAPGDSNAATGSSSGTSEGVARQNKLHEVWDKIRTLPIWKSNRMVAFFIAIGVAIIGIIATVVGTAFLLLWLHLASYLAGFLRLFTHITIMINGTGFLVVGLIGFVAIVVSWVKGLFYYATITPNYMDLQEGPSESGEQISREDYNTRLDTSNFLERLLGFGKIEITFKYGSRHPLRYLVWGIGKKAQKLEKVRAKFVIDHKQSRRLAGGNAMSLDTP